MGKLFLDVARAAAAALAFMFATSTGHAATLTSASAVTLPSTIGASTTIGPQTVQVSLTQQYTATFPVNLRLSISDANFVTTSVAPPTLTVSGSVTGGGCTLDSYPTVLIIVCTPVGSNTITGLTIAGLNYTAATTLSSGGSIKLSGALTNTAGTITAEELPSTAVVQAAVATPTTYTLTTSTTGSGTGTVSVTPSSGPYAAGTIVTLTATAASGSTFTHWTGGGCSTSATCAVTMNENQTVSATFTAAATTPGNPSDGAGSVNSRRLTVNPVGGGTVTSNPNGINCTTECSTNFAINQAVVLTAVPGPGSQVISWSGCAPIYASPTSCLITMAGDASVTVTFFAHSGATSNVVQQGAVYSSAQTSAQSLFRFYNAGTSAGTVTVTLADSVTGQTLTTWTSPSIAPGAAPQYPISTLEGVSTFTKPNTYFATIESQFSGTFQHVLYRPSDGVLTNLSTCDVGVTAPPTRIVNVHSSRVGTIGFPSTVVISNAGAAATSVGLAISDARDGTSLGTYPAVAVPAKSDLVLPVATIEAAAGIVPTADQLHYVIKSLTSLSTYLQHRVNNQQAAVVTDMSTVCAFISPTTPTAPTPSTPSDRRE